MRSNSCGSRRIGPAATNRLRWLTFAALGALLVLLAAAGLAVVHSARPRQRALHEVQEHSRRRAAILDSAMEAILTLNPSGTIESLNAAGERMFGYAEAELLHRDVGILFADPRPIGAVASKLRQMKLEAGQPGMDQQIAARRKDGTNFPTDVAIAAMPLAQGHSYVMDFRNQPVDLRDCCREAIEAMRGFARKYGVVLDAELSERPAIVDADPDRLAQVLANLLSNAIKFSPVGGTVRLGLVADRERHRLTVSDLGPGIPEAFRDRMFTRFAQADSSDTRQKGGTGLGLSIVREIVRRLGG